MTNPFMYYGTGSSSSVSVNGIKPNIRGNVILPLAKLPDCTIANPTNSQCLIYNGGVWTNEDITTSGILPIPYLNTDHDVLLSNLTDKDILSYNASTTKWNNISTIDLSNIPSLPESKITNLTTDLSACEKAVNKGAI